MLAAETVEKVLEPEDIEIPLEERVCPCRTKSRVVGASNAERVLRVVANVYEKGERVFMEAEFTPKTCSNIEYEVRKGCEAMFVHLFDAGDKETKFLLPLALMAQCTWYEENGYPSVVQLTEAASAAVQFELGLEQ